MNLAALWTYQKERFPLARTLPLLGVFSAAAIAVSAAAGGRPYPGWGGFAAGLVLAMLVFFQMRACDEWKDLEDDRRYRPDRPIPRTCQPVLSRPAMRWPPTNPDPPVTRAVRAMGKGGVG